MRVLGVDYGLRKVGLALGDTDVHVASPLEVWSHGGFDEDLAARLVAFAQEEDVGTIVVGIPTRQDGTATEQGERHRAFAHQLETMSPVPVVLVDEAFTTKESRRLQEEYGSDVEEDALAAMLIVRGYFDQVL